VEDTDATVAPKSNLVGRLVQMVGLWTVPWQRARGLIVTMLSGLWDEIRPRDRNDLLVIAVIAASIAIMVYNTAAHPPKEAYDYREHSPAIARNASLQDLWPKTAPGNLEYNPPLYYALFAKPNRLLELLAGRSLEPYYVFRVGHLVMITLAALVLARGLVPRMTADPRLRLWFALGLFVIPNIFLAQVMVRADHLLLFCVSMLFYLWFRFDFPTQLPHSNWRLAAWVACLVGMANARSFALPAFALFFFWGLWAIREGHGGRWSRDIRWRVVIAVGLVIALGGQHYLARYARTGLVLSQRIDLPYWARYEKLQRGFDRVPMFTNVQFDVLLTTPNRHAAFRGGNALWPRLYGDMWTDHWLYFSGPRHGIEMKAEFKRVALIAAIPFTVFYLGACIAAFPRAWLRWRRGLSFDAPSAAALVFLGGLALLIVFVYQEPEVGKNATVKFCYLLGYIWLPLLAMLDRAGDYPRLSPMLLGYTALLAAICLPLYVFIP
jgi:hypothetical protein